MLACKLEKPSNEGCVLPFPFASNDGRPSNKIRQHNGSPVGSDLSRPGAGAGRRCCNSCSLFWLRAQRARRSLGLQAPPIFFHAWRGPVFKAFKAHHVLIGRNFVSPCVTRHEAAKLPGHRVAAMSTMPGACRPVVRRRSTQLRISTRSPERV